MQTEGLITVKMPFRFGKEGSIDSIFVEGRATTVGTETVLMPWECRMLNYQTKGGMRVPLTGAVLYILPTGERPYFKGTIETVDYEFAREYGIRCQSDIGTRMPPVPQYRSMGPAIVVIKAWALTPIRIRHRAMKSWRRKHRSLTFWRCDTLI